MDTAVVAESVGGTEDETLEVELAVVSDSSVPEASWPTLPPN